MIKKIGYIFSFFCFLFIVGYLLMHLFESSKPMSNTEEYLKAHGYIEGQKNDIRLGGVLLRFPAGVKYSPHTNGAIVKGVADNVDTGLFYPNLNENNSTANGVIIELISGGMANPSQWTELDEKKEWESIIKDDELDLIEYKGKISGVTYVAESNNYVTPQGGVIKYDCSEVNDQIIQCQSTYVHKSKIIVSYLINGKNLKNWKEIHNEVIKFVDSIIIEE